jgi:hypothetical protein
MAWRYARTTASPPVGGATVVHSMLSLEAVDFDAPDQHVRRSDLHALGWIDDPAKVTALRLRPSNGDRRRRR